MNETFGLPSTGEKMLRPLKVSPYLKALETGAKAGAACACAELRVRQHWRKLDARQRLQMLQPVQQAPAVSLRRRRPDGQSDGR